MPDEDEIPEEIAYRRPGRAGTAVIAAVAVGWSLFQLFIAFPSTGIVLDAVIVRAIHLGFAMALVFLSVPGLRTPRRWLAWAAIKDRIPIYDIVLAVVGCGAAVYLALDYAAITERAGLPKTRDIVVGIVLILLLLEGARRVIGPALSVVALLFCLWAFCAESMPSFLAARNSSLNTFISQMTMSSEGIYGIPLDVSASIVFLFVLFGAMLERAGGGRFFIELALSVLGGFRGGPAKAAVLGSGMTGMVSGSSIANIVTTGTFTIPMMKKVGYPPTKAASIEVAASTDGQIAPPIMGAAAFIIAEYVAVPYSAVIKAAIVPAFASYCALFYITHLEACKLGLPRIPREELPRFRKVLACGWHFLIPLGVLIYHLIVARHSPELSAFHAIWVMALVWVAERLWRAKQKNEPLRPAAKAVGLDILAALETGARNMLAVALATAAAGIIVGIVSLGLGGLITGIIEQLSMGNIILMLILTAGASLLLGMGLPTTATYIVMATLIAPAIVVIGAKYDMTVPLIAAHLFCFYFGILADDTPPVGLAAYAASAIAKSPPIATGIQAFLYDIRTAILPFMFIFNSDLILHGITSWAQGLLIFVMACAANCAFAAATQGWYARANRWPETIALLLAMVPLFRPDFVAKYIGLAHEQRYWCYLIGIAIMVVVYLVQWRRGDDCKAIANPSH